MTLKGKCVLVVDDVADQRMLVRKILENVGVEVMEADSVDQALELFAKKAPHLIFLDLQMPKKTGYTLLEAKATNPVIQNIPVVVTSGLKDKESVFKAISLGANDYLVKPVNAPQLVQKVRKYLKDTEFKTFQFPEKSLPVVQVALSSQLTKLTNTGLTLESSIKIGQNTRVHLEGNKADELKLSQQILATGALHSIRALSGQYATKINIVGGKKK